MWNILIIRPQRELAAAERLEDIGFTTYLPMIRRCARHGRARNRTIARMPMFPGYLFVMAKNDSQSRVRPVTGVRGYLHSGGRPASISEAAIDEIRTTEERASDKRASPFQAGDRVKVSRPGHPAHMMQGILSRIHGNDRAILEAMNSQRKVTVQLKWLETA